MILQTLRSRLALPLLRLLPAAALLLGPAAFADEPKFEYGKEPGAKLVKWAGQGKFGLLLAAGNAQALSLTAGVAVSREDVDNRFAVDANLAFVRSSLTVVNDVNGDGLVGPGEDVRLTQTSSQAWAAKGRYDRFFAEANSGFVTGHVASDPPAGKQLVAGVQVGYARRVWKTERNLTAAEIGYDFTSEQAVVASSPTSIHSARLFLSHTLKLTDASGFTVSVEALSNLNEESAANPDGTNVVAPLHDTRVNATASITAKLLGNVQLAVTGTMHYDQNPSLRGKIAGMDFAPGYTPFAEPIDALVEATILVAFL